MKKRAIAYIDGYNLYYGLLKGTPHKWLDLYSFARSLIRRDCDLVAVKYFTAPIKTYPHDFAAVDRQKVYLQAIAASGNVEVTLGFYAKNKALVPYADSRCAPCEVVANGFVPVYKLEEKRSDVNLAVSLVTDAATNSADCFAVITGDSDQVGAIETVRYRFRKPVIVFNPHVGESLHLKRAATYYRNIPRDLPAQHQLPDEIPYGKRRDRFIHRPVAWTSLTTSTPEITS